MLFPRAGRWESLGAIGLASLEVSVTGEVWPRSKEARAMDPRPTAHLLKKCRRVVSSKSGLVISSMLTGGNYGKRLFGSTPVAPDAPLKSTRKQGNLFLNREWTPMNANRKEGEPRRDVVSTLSIKSCLESIHSKSATIRVYSRLKLFILEKQFSHKEHRDHKEE